MSALKNAFAHFGLEQSILSALSDLGYEGATPIQEQSIPILLNGEDLLAQAQTGTGKTAAFALPILSKLDLAQRSPQALILVPTRELAIQVAEAFQSYAKHIKGFSVTPIYGGQDFGTQLRSLKRGSHVIVGTPGRLMDHMRRKTLPLSTLKSIVLDEADEMLKMGFAEDVEWILAQLTAPHQTALFSATIPSTIQKIAQRYLKDAKKIQIKSHTNTVEAIEQCYVTVANRAQKMDVLTRLLEIEDNQGVIVFTRTKTESAEIAEKLQARGYAACALNGDMSQNAREKTINRLRKGDLDILVATDVAARGIDVDRITHVINYDIPYDVDAYVHRIGRTGRAGREGKAILFVTPREQRLFRDIEQHIHKSIKRIEPPSIKVIKEKRVSQMADKIKKIILEKKNELVLFVEPVDRLTEECACSPKEIAAAMMYLNEAQSAKSTIVSEESFTEKNNFQQRDHRGSRNRDSRSLRDRGNRGRPYENRSGGNRRFSHHDRSESRRQFESPNKPERFEKSVYSDKPTRFETGDAHTREPRNFKEIKAPRDFKEQKKSRSFDRDHRKDAPFTKFSERRPRPPRNFK